MPNWPSKRHSKKGCCMSRVAKRRAFRRRFNVHVYPVIRITFKSVIAKSRRDAIHKAMDRLPPETLSARFDNDDSGYAEEFSHFLVGFAGDKDFRRYRWYHSSQESLIPLLQRLVDWHGTPRRRVQQLDAIVAEARQALRTTI